MEAQKLYAAGDMESALMMYLLLSELGFEVAQSNAAYILDQGKISILALCYTTRATNLCIVIREVWMLT